MKTIGPWTLHEEVGRGGMGVVYRATHAMIPESFAMKVILPRHAQDAEARERFLREVRIAHQLRHPNIVHHELPFEDGGEIYLPMELLEGNTLDTVLEFRRAPFVEEEAVDIVRQVASGLAHAHQRQEPVIHRDIKLANLHLDLNSGRVRILDFGIAKAASGESLTQTGMSIGTPNFMAPELFMGTAPPTPAVDVFALGLVLFELVTKVSPIELPKDDSNLIRLMGLVTTAHAQGLPRVRERLPSLSPRLQRLIQGMTEVDPGRRLKDGAEVLQLIESIPEAGAPVPSGQVSMDPRGLAVGPLPKLGTPPPTPYPVSPPSGSLPGQPRPKASRVPVWIFGFASLVTVGFIVGVAAYTQMPVLSCPGRTAQGCVDRGLDFAKGRGGVEQDFTKANALFQKACDGGNGAGCNQLGLNHENGRGVTKSLTRANDLYEKGCSFKHGAACTNLGLNHELGLGFSINLKRANSLYEEACEASDLRGCTYLGLNYQNAKGTDKNYALARMLYNKACDAEYGDGCTNLGRLYEEGWGVNKEVGRAKDLYQKACRLNSNVGCTNTGIFLQYGYGGSKDLVSARKYYTKGCDRGHGRGCTKLGYLYREGLGGRKDLKEAGRLFKKACDKGHKRGCWHLAYAYDEGKGLPVDKTKARGLYEKACNAGYGGACTNLGFLTEFGRGGPKDLNRARSLYRTGCNKGDGTGCTNLGIFYYYGKGGSEDRSQANVFFDKGCNADHGRGCYRRGLSYRRGVGERSLSKARSYFRKACRLGHSEACSD